MLPEEIKIQNKKFQLGFTLIVLIVVVGIMVVMTSLMVLNLNGQRSSRELKIAQSNLVSNIRKIQSYTLAARSLPSGQSVQYYIIKFNLAEPTKYVIQAMYNTNSSPQYLQDVETVYLPTNIRFSQVSPVVITRINTPTQQTPTSCALLAFSAPFGKTFLNDGCAIAGTVGNPSTLGSSANTDDYKKIINYVTNVDCISSSNPICTVSADSTMVITLSTKDGTLTKTVTINGITGAVSFN